MVEIHLATAARPTEICEMRIENIDRKTDDLWAVRLDHHKTDYLENAETKILYLAKPEIDVLLPLIGERTEGYIFRPIDSILYEKERRATGAVFVKKQPSRAARDAERAKNPKQEFGECYDFHAYRKAVYRACDRAGIVRWFPYQLRHTGITRIGLEHGVEARNTPPDTKTSKRHCDIFTEKTKSPNGSPLPEIIRR
jgi:integrase